MHYFYFDTSGIAKRYSSETGSKKIDDIIGDKSNIVVIGNIAITELYSAISKKYRIGEISRQDFPLREQVCNLLPTFANYELMSSGYKSEPAKGYHGCQNSHPKTS